MSEAAVVVLPDCRRCREKIEGEIASARNGYGDELLYHPACLVEARAAQEREAAERKKREGEQNARRIENWFSSWTSCGGKYPTPDNLPRWPWARFDNPEFQKRASKQILGAMSRWAPDKGSIILSAKTGRGKSAACVAWLWQMRDTAIAAALAGEPYKFHRFCWAMGAELVKARRLYPLGEGEATLVELAMDQHVLILDDLMSEPMNEVMFEVVDLRYRKQYPTIVTTGLDRKAFRDRYGDAMYRRLTEAGTVIEVTE